MPTGIRYLTTYLILIICNLVRFILGSCFDGSLGNLAPIGESASGEGGSGSGRRGRPRRNTHSTGLLASQHRVGSSAGARRSGSGGDLPSLEEEGASGGGGGGTGAPVLIINPATGRRVGGTRSRPRRNSERIRGSSGENVRNHLATAGMCLVAGVCLHVHGLSLVVCG